MAGKVSQKLRVSTVLAKNPSSVTDTYDFSSRRSVNLGYHGHLYSYVQSACACTCVYRCTHTLNYFKGAELGIWLNIQVFA